MILLLLWNRDDMSEWKGLKRDVDWNLPRTLFRACRLTWYATVVAELLRLRNQSQAVDFFDDLLDQIYTCRAL